MTSCSRIAVICESLCLWVFVWSKCHPRHRSTARTLSSYHPHHKGGEKYLHCCARHNLTDIHKYTYNPFQSYQGLICGSFLHSISFTTFKHNDRSKLKTHKAPCMLPCIWQEESYNFVWLRKSFSGLRKWDSWPWSSTRKLFPEFVTMTTNFNLLQLDSFLLKDVFAGFQLFQTAC